jgi:hypothetical protein
MAHRELTVKPGDEVLKNVYYTSRELAVMTGVSRYEIEKALRSGKLQSRCPEGTKKNRRVRGDWWLAYDATCVMGG